MVHYRAERDEKLLPSLLEMILEIGVVFHADKLLHDFAKVAQHLIVVTRAGEFEAVLVVLEPKLVAEVIRQDAVGHEVLFDNFLPHSCEQETLHIDSLGVVFGFLNNKRVVFCQYFDPNEDERLVELFIFVVPEVRIVPAFQQMRLLPRPSLILRQKVEYDGQNVLVLHLRQAELSFVLVNIGFVQRIENIRRDARYVELRSVDRLDFHCLLKNILWNFGNIVINPKLFLKFGHHAIVALRR